jgi:hypothetical protein
MSAEEPNSQVIIRRVTKAWEFKDRRLRYYDFEKDEFEFDSSRFLLTADTSYGADVEKLLNLHIETHLASYLHTITTEPLAEDLPWLQRRAMSRASGRRVPAHRRSAWEIDGDRRGHHRGHPTLWLSGLGRRTSRDALDGGSAWPRCRPAARRCRGCRRASQSPPA